jgi:hypothetical protein
VPEDERDAMMGSLREATKGTKFDRWLDAVQPGQVSALAGADAAGAVACNRHAEPAAGSGHAHGGQGLEMELREVVAYLHGGALRMRPQPSNTALPGSDLP